jgi:1-acyl-sn-glycerol-3-phosphate acyltransferase
VGRKALVLLVQAPLAAIVTATLAAVAVLVGLAPRGERACQVLSRHWARALLWLARVRVVVEGTERAPGRSAVYAANHASALDILVVFGHLPVDFRIIHKRSLYLVPLFGWALWLAGHIGIDRRHPFRARRSLDRAARRIREGANVLVFPEGTRMRGPEIGRFKRGSFSLALEAGAPVVPVSIVGIRDVVPAGLPSLRPGVVRLRLHAALPVEGRSPEDAERLAQEVRALVAAGCGAASSEPR